MKKSLFNVFVNLENEETLLYNTYSTSLIVLDNVMCSNIKDEKFENLSSTDLAALLEMGFLVEDERDELLDLEKTRKSEIEQVEQVVTIFSTNRCNARCYYCFEKGINYEHMSEETARKTVEFILQFYPKKELSIKWFGGEPLYNFESIRLITERLIAEGYSLKCHITTNGSLLTQEMLDFFKSNYSIVTFQITIDDIGESYNKIKKYAEGDFEDPYRIVVNNCRMVIANKMHVSIRINHLFEKFEKAVEIHHSLQKEFEDLDSNYYLIYLANLTLPGKRTYIKSEHDKELAVRMQEFNRRHRPVGDIDDKYLLYKHDLLPKLKHCAATNKYNLTITADGKIFKCHRLAQHSQYIIGSVEDGVDEMAPNFAFFTEYRIVDQECRQCYALPICQGACRSLYLLEGSKLDCDLKKMLPDLIKNYYNDIVK